ncbi:AbiV family abortive infection protein [Vibrio splendidus]
MSLSIKQIDNYIQALTENARSLHKESELLFKKKAFARSYTLSHIAREEIAKCHILYAAGRRVIAGIDVDWKQTMKRLRDHKAKLRQEAVSHAGMCMIDGNEKAFDLNMRAAQPSADLRNDYKNNSLYVGISSDGNILKPNHVIEKDRAQSNIELARYAIADEVNFQSKVGKLSKMDPSKLVDISNVDSMTEEEHREALRRLSQAIGKGDLP